MPDTIEVDLHSADTTQEPTSSMNLVADHGDVNFLMQPSKNSTTIRVSSVVLGFASPVFGALLGQQFKEGQGERSATSRKEILLVGDNHTDNRTAMVDLCDILHHKQTDMQDLDATYDSSTRLLELCIISDKYDRGSTIALAVEGLFSRFLRGHEFKLHGDGHLLEYHYPALLNLTAAAYVLRLRIHNAQSTGISAQACAQNSPAASDMV